MVADRILPVQDREGTTAELSLRSIRAQVVLRKLFVR